MSIRNIFILTALCGILYGCQKQDTEYRQYLEDKEVIYPGVPSNVSYKPGYKKVEFVWRSSPDPSISRYVVYWNDLADSAILQVPDGKQSEFTGGVVNNLKEGTYFFVIHAFDKNNNKSIPVSINNVSVYGDFYLDGLVNRTVQSTNLDASNVITVTFNAPSNATNAFTEIKYTSTADVEKKQLVPPSANLATISDWKLGTSVVYRSAYKPVPNSLDTFYAKRYDTMVIKQDVTAQFLVNTSQPFQPVQSSNRFRDPFGWTVNATIQNHNNMGGWGTDDNTVLCMESGWGAPNITNGKMYQTAVLPAGTYSFQINLGSYGYGSNIVRIVAVPGNTLPDLDGAQVPGALGSAELGIRSFTFTNPSEGPVSLGFLVNMVGNQYWRVTKVRLLRHY